MTKEAQELRTAAEQAKYQYAIGAITYEDMVAVAQKYIDHCNERAVAIAKEFGMKPKKMSVKAFIR